ncbi:hypothetical protein A2118_00740 [Candidatus Kaiserbacteria bacterium GWA2_50_9]|uniref:Uncharacterized protein n=1 Tax=Candidatus Kaiserbacteria bacterium GWA2_50_9 TaxID=1798474 RepID=A0A1F6BSJ5_9BACT|nr:MAG: hypothetical protein A2118_00740 [Candidatus Kaiserbacteria bacterium GWA2_50_9]
MHSPSIREKALELRKNGFSYKYISSKTGLSKATLSGWLAEIHYKPNEETVSAFGRARAAASARRAELRQQSIEEIRKVATKEVGKIHQRDLFMFGLGLYMGEGCKTNSQIRVMNSDHRIIQAIIAWFRMLGVERRQIRLRLHLYPDNDVKQSLQFWSRATSIPLSRFQKSQIDRRTDKKAKMRRKLPFGTAQLTVQGGGRKEYGVLFFRKIQLWNEAVSLGVQKADVV